MKSRIFIVIIAVLIAVTGIFLVENSLVAGECFCVDYFAVETWCTLYCVWGHGGCLGTTAGYGCHCVLTTYNCRCKVTFQCRDGYQEEVETEIFCYSDCHPVET